MPRRRYLLLCQVEMDGCAIPRQPIPLFSPGNRRTVR